MSPPELAPPSTIALCGNGYGPGSLCVGFWKVIGTPAWFAGTVCHGMP
jgi:hypothetical protein